mgnify:CR=1 FL=1
MRNPTLVQFQIIPILLATAFAANAEPEMDAAPDEGTTFNLSLRFAVNLAIENNLGIEVARRGLWREALYRWQRAIDLDPTYAPAWNNLGIAFEYEGRFDEAREAYETALDLDPNNFLIEQNYDLFLEVNDRVNQNTR